MRPKGFAHERASEGPTNTWLTPKALTDLVQPIDLDPCSAPSPRPWDFAKRHITLPECGLAADWGRAFVFCNPPYGPHTGVWLKRMAAHGNGVALVFARTETAAFAEGVWGKADGIFFLRGRVQFCTPDGKPGGRCAAPSVLIAYGAEAARRLQAIDAAWGYYAPLMSAAALLGDLL